MFEFNKDLLNAWRFRASSDISYNYTPLIFNDKNLTVKAFSATLNIYNHFSFPGKFTPYIDFNVQWGYAQQRLGIGNTWFLNTRLSFSKEIIRYLNVDLSVQWDPADRLKVKTTLPDYLQEIKKNQIPVSASIYITYTFGKQAMRKYRQEGDTSYKNRF